MRKSSAPTPVSSKPGSLKPGSLTVPGLQRPLSIVSGGIASTKKRPSVASVAHTVGRLSVTLGGKPPPSSKISAPVNNMRRESSFANFYRNVFIAESSSSPTAPTANDDFSSSSSQNTFDEMDFRLPDLEVKLGMDLNDVLLHDKHKQHYRSIKRQIKDERLTMRRLDDLAATTDKQLSTRFLKGTTMSNAATRAIRMKLESEAELATVRHVVRRKPGELADQLVAMKTQIEEESLHGIDDDQRESSIDHPKLNSVHEKMEDLRQETTEQWCALRGKQMMEKHTNKDKRMLRKWFQQLDYDGSGEVNVEELQDPMLSSGILKTREQVVRVLANVDRNNTMGIDFEEFLVALSANKLADQSKLKKLQEMSAHPFFDVDTLITAERRKKLYKTIVNHCQFRQAEVEALYKKYDKPKLTRKERESWIHEVELLEEKQSKSIYLHMKYVHALDGVLQDKKEFYKTQEEDRYEQAQEEKRQRHMLSPLSISRPGHNMMGGGGGGRTASPLAPRTRNIRMTKARSSSTPIASTPRRPSGTGAGRGGRGASTCSGMEAHKGVKGGH